MKVMVLSAFLARFSFFDFCLSSLFFLRPRSCQSFSIPVGGFSGGRIELPRGRPDGRKATLPPVFITRGRRRGRRKRRRRGGEAGGETSLGMDAYASVYTLVHMLVK